MATASEGLECPICCERFNDQTFCPRLLSCGHSFCSGCLERLLNSNTINCPTCRITSSVPAGVKGLSKNFALLAIVNATPHQATRITPQHAKDGGFRMCEACEGEEHPATSCCLDCKEDMCKTAAGFHTRSKASRDHRVISLEELQASPNLAAVSVFCPEHNDRYRYFDEDCGHVVCRDCFALKHSGHKCVSIDKAASKYRQEMAALVTKASTHIEEIKAAEARVANVSLDLREAYKKTTAQIKDMFKELYAALAAREQLLMNELDQLHKTKAVTLTEQHDRLRTFHGCLQSVVLRAKSTIQSSGNAELLVTRSDIDSTLRGIESHSPVLEPQDDCVLGVTFDRTHLLDVLNNAGVVISNSYTCAETTTATGLGVRLTAPGRQNEFTITAHDAKGRPRRLGGDVFVVEFKETGIEVNVEDKGDGTYLATYTVPQNAVLDYHCTLSVRVGGTHIQGSPFKVKVVTLSQLNRARRVWARRVSSSTQSSYHYIS